MGPAGFIEIIVAKALYKPRSIVTRVYIITLYYYIVYTRPGAAKLLLRPGSELLLHLNHGGEEDDDNDDDDDDDYDDYHDDNICVCVCSGVQRRHCRRYFLPFPSPLSERPTEKRVPVLARCRSDGRLVVSREGHGVFTVSHYRRYHKTCRLGAKENGQS